MVIRGVHSPKQQEPDRHAQTEIFSGWKEIASYLGKGVRSVQRYACENGLPIHRPSGRSGGAVIATKGELNGWVMSAPRQVAKKLSLTVQTYRMGAEFLQIDSEIGLTFSRLALTA